ncbi:MAG TPA: hypothetical protein VKF62_03720 [Planctomycetota bacterium]|nr:hypothetical protein [Planctomycetota bacterium]
MKRTKPKGRDRETAIIQQVERTIRRLERGGDVVMKEAQRVVETLRQAEKLFEQHGRLDMANSARAARISLAAHLSEFEPE